MSVKLSRYVFRRVGGRIIPIRKGIQQATKQITKLAGEVLSAPKSLKTGSYSRKLLVGKGLDFSVFGKKSSIVMKVPNKSMGTSNKAFTRAYPETSDKVALSKAVSDNLPNYGIPTIDQEVVRIKGKLKAIVQKKVKQTPHSDRLKWHKAFQNRKHYIDTADRLKKDTGLTIDAHGGNFDDHGNMIDTGLNLKTSSIKKVKYNDMAKEILGVENNWGSEIKDHINPQVLTDQALLEGTSKKALRKINALMKQGYKYKQSGKNEYKLVFHKLGNKK